MRASRLFTASLALLFVATTPLRAQVAESQIPKELALALLPFGGSDGGEIVVGQLPPDLASTFTLPAGGRVLGSFVGLTYSAMVIVLPGNIDSAAAFARRSLTAHGWIPRQMPTPRIGGLRYGTPQSTLPTTFCKTGAPEFISFQTQFHGPGMTLLRLTRNVGSNPCEESSGNMAMSVSSGATIGTIRSSVTTLSPGNIGDRMPEMPLSSVPPLYAPTSDFRASQVCRQATSGMGSQSQDQPLRTELSQAQILAHYGRQLDSAGWKPAGADSSATGTWMNAATGQQVTITVTKMAQQPGCYNVQLSATSRHNNR